MSFKLVPSSSPILSLITFSVSSVNLIFEPFLLILLYFYFQIITFQSGIMNCLNTRFDILRSWKVFLAVFTRIGSKICFDLTFDFALKSFLIFSLFFFRPLLLKLFTFLCFAATSFNAFSSWAMASAFLVVVSGKTRVWTITQRTGVSSFSFAGFIFFAYDEFFLGLLNDCMTAKSGLWSIFKGSVVKFLAMAFLSSNVALLTPFLKTCSSTISVLSVDS